MVSAYPESSYSQHRASLQSRLASFFLSLGVCALLLLMLMTLGVLSPQSANLNKLVAISFPPAGSAPKHASNVTRQKQVQPQTRVQPTVVVPNPEPTTPPLNMIVLTRQQFAAADISKMAHQSYGPPADSGSGQGSGTAAGDGDGPGGQHLYNAEWYRKPTRAELATYFPNSTHGGQWGIIACKTAPNYHVEDCQELSESAGSGLSRAMRQAAWQFLVIPPRIDGRAQIGTWVRIRYDIVDAQAGKTDVNADLNLPG
jgi:protein TonB